MTAVRKRQQLTGMKYDRVDLVPDGANAHAHILIAKNKGAGEKVLTVSKAMGSVKCNHCGKMNGKGANVCRYCHSTDLAKTLVEVKKTVVNPKKVPKNDDATNSTSNASGYTFEDEQYDQDNGENGQALGDSVERSVLEKSGWFEIRKDDIGDVNNERNEREKEGEDPDDDIEELSMRKPVGTRPDKRSGYIDGNTGANDVMTATAKGLRPVIKKKFLKEKPGLNSFDYGDQGSQEVAESAEQMYRSESQPTEEAQERRESTMSDVLAKAGRRRRKNAEGLDILENGNTGIYQRPGVKRNGTNTGHNKTTNAGRTAVAPPKNPLDVGKSLRVRKSREMDPLAQLEALNVGVSLAENLGLIIQKGRPELYETVVKDFLGSLSAYFGEWQSGGTVTKSKTAEAQVEDIADRVEAILAKASPESEMSDEAAEGESPDSVDSKRPKLYSKKSQNAGEDNTSVGKNRVNKSLTDGDDPYAGLHPVVKSQLQELKEFRKMQQEAEYLKKARTLRGLPGFDEARIAKQLQNTYETLGEEDGDLLYQTLSASAAAVQDSGIFKQYGLPGSGTSSSDDPMARADEWAKTQINKSGEGKTIEQLRVDYMREHPGEFYQPAKSL